MRTYHFGVVTCLRVSPANRGAQLGKSRKMRQSGVCWCLRGAYFRGNLSVVEALSVFIGTFSGQKELPRVHAKALQPNGLWRFFGIAVIFFRLCHRCLPPVSPLLHLPFLLLLVPSMKISSSHCNPFVCIRVLSEKLSFYLSCSYSAKKLSFVQGSSTLLFLWGCAIFQLHLAICDLLSLKDESSINVW